MNESVGLRDGGLIDIASKVLANRGFCASGSLERNAGDTASNRTNATGDGRIIWREFLRRLSRTLRCQSWHDRLGDKTTASTGHHLRNRTRELARHSLRFIERTSDVLFDGPADTLSARQANHRGLLPTHVDIFLGISGPALRQPGDVLDNIEETSASRGPQLGNRIGQAREVDRTLSESRWNSLCHVGGIGRPAACKRVVFDRYKIWLTRRNRNAKRPTALGRPLCKRIVIDWN